jgi:putative oxidoreductase
LNIKILELENYMKIASLISRLLLGVIFVVFGLNGFLHFIKAPMPEGIAGQFAGALFGTKYYVVIFGVQLISGLLFLANRFVPLALVLIGPVIVNILCFHGLLGAPGLPMAIVVALLWVILAIHNKQHLAGIFVQRT